MDKSPSDQTAARLASIYCYTAHALSMLDT